MNIYVAARCKRREEIHAFYCELEARGHRITTKWTEYPSINYFEDPDGARERIAADLEGIRTADVIILLSEFEPDSRGSHVELGYALKEAETRPLKIFIVFPGENLSMFYRHPAVSLLKDKSELFPFLVS